MKYFLIFFISIFNFETRAELPTISGISSGGFMAVQMATIYSSEFSGVGTFAGGFYFCAQNYLQDKIFEGQATLIGAKNLFLFSPSKEFYKDSFNLSGILKTDKSKWLMPAEHNPIYMSVGICMHNPLKAKLPDLKEAESVNRITPIHSFKDLRAYIYQGSNDTVLAPDMLQKLNAFYLQNGIAKENVKISTSQGAHNFPTDREGLNECSSQEVPFVSSCGLNGAKEVLEHLLNRKLEKSRFQKDHLYVVDQNILLSPEALSNSIAPYGYLYASDYCLNNPKSCHLHIALHGCEMSDSFDSEFDQKYTDQVKTTLNLTMRRRDQLLVDLNNVLYIEQSVPRWGALKFAIQSGYAEFAEKNNLMILFPQTWITEENYPYNPKGCWDWYGWTGDGYATQKGIETSWLMNYIKAISTQPQSYLLKQRPRLQDLK